MFEVPTAEPVQAKAAEPEKVPEPEPEPAADALPEAVPPGAASSEQPEPAADALPEGWKAVVSESTGETYYKNTLTDDTTWDRPTAAASAPTTPKAPAPTTPKAPAPTTPKAPASATPAKKVPTLFFLLRSKRALHRTSLR